MCLYGIFGDAEFIPDFLITLAVSDQLENLHFTYAQLGVTYIFCKLPRSARSR